MLYSYKKRDKTAYPFSKESAMKENKEINILKHIRFSYIPLGFPLANQRADKRLKTILAKL